MFLKESSNKIKGAKANKRYFIYVYVAINYMRNFKNIKINLYDKQICEGFPMKTEYI